MTTNGYARDYRDRMNVRDLEVGQTLIETSSYGYGTHHTFTEWTIAKITTTRLVLERNAFNSTPANPVKATLRMLLENSKYAGSSKGTVKTTAEGDSSRHNSHILYTADDTALASLRDLNVTLDITRAATAAAEKVSFRHGMTVENATAAIEALQAFIAHANKES